MHFSARTNSNFGLCGLIRSLRTFALNHLTRILIGTAGTCEIPCMDSGVKPHLNISVFSLQGALFLQASCLVRSLDGVFADNGCNRVFVLLMGRPLNGACRWTS